VGAIVGVRMIGSILRFLFLRPAGLIVLGVVIIGLGVLLTSMGHAGVPDRSALTEVSGVLETATKITRERRRGGKSVSYELSIKPASGEVIKLTLPEREIREETVRSLMGRPIAALYSGEKDVWELSSGTTRIIEYETTRQRRLETQAFEAAVGPYIGGGGLLVALAGIFWLFRRRQAPAAASA
jgi:hypothetical protein